MEALDSGDKVGDRRLLIIIFCLVLLTASIAHGAGVTIITHGFNGNVTDWVIPMAQKIPNYDLFPGSSYSCYEMIVGSDYSVSMYRIGGVSPTASDSGEIIIKLDWSALSVDPFTSSTDVALSVVPALLSTTFISELGGRSLTEFPIHLIGHSRGGSVVSEMARLLGSQGVWVDHLTTLDPHPVAFYGDAEINLYRNTLFADNYSQTNPGLTCPNGETVFGAYNRYLANLQGGYDCGHSDVHLWYQGTIDWFTTPSTDTQATITSSERSTWWTDSEYSGLIAGFKWSLIGRGNRLTAYEPAGAGTGRVRDGYNQIWEFGAGRSGNRSSLPLNNGNWPNIVKFDVTGSNVVVVGSSVTNKYYYQFAQSASPTATVQIFLDFDANPYNGDSSQVFQMTETGTGTSVMRSRTVSFNATNAPGQYFVYAKVTGGGHVRYLHAPEKLTIVPVPDTTKPTISITYPLAMLRLSNSIVTVEGKASDNVAVSNVLFSVNGSDFQAATGTTNWSAAISLIPGTNSVRVQAQDVSGNLSVTETRAIIYVAVSPLIVGIAGSGTVSPNYNGQLLEVGRRYQMKAAARPGFLFSNWSGTINTTNPLLAFQMQPNAMLTANFVPNPFLTAKGIYNGLVMDTNNVTFTNAGMINLTLTDKGIFSGKLLLAGASLPLAGSFGVDGKATVKINRIGKPALTNQLVLDLVGKEALGGSVSDGAFTNTIQADKAVFSTTNLSPYAGKYTLIIPGTNEVTGDGIGTVNVSTAGTITFSGALADGTVVNQSVPVSRTGWWPVYLPLYTGKGMFISWAQFDTNGTRNINGDAVWIKRPQPGRYFTNGFTLKTMVDGGGYRAPADGPTNLVLSMTNGTVTLSGGTLSTPIVNGIVLTNNNVLRITGTNGLKLTITPSSGLVSGSFIHPVTKALTPIKAVVQQGRTNIDGFFLGTNASGTILLQP